MLRWGSLVAAHNGCRRLGLTAADMHVALAGGGVESGGGRMPSPDAEIERERLLRRREVGAYV